ncbi:putative ferric reductase transmembrane component [Rhizoctonia solani 123E]|uniref:Putative ferric reductase transmembrane component n=1 Tax=Rhizoctonia solani 123E TaxID=1423351 RepID=A0A074RXN0_9AGAM|nr:putative ferric reductase transmembrane component [Rhizoctonia solani 123E]
MSSQMVFASHLLFGSGPYNWKETDPKYAYAFTAGWVSVALAIAIFRLPNGIRSLWQSSGRIHPALALGIRERTEMPKHGASTHSIPSAGRSRISIWASVAGACLMYVPPGFKLDIGQCLVVTSYLLLAAFCIFDHPDLLSFPNRPGFIAVAQFPVLFLTAAKYNPLFAFIGRGHDKLNFLHRWAGRGVSMAAVVHTVFWVWKRFRTGRACRLYTNQADMTGIAATVVLTIMVVLSRSQVRRRCYELFFVSHVVGTVVFMILLFFHVKWYLAGTWLLTPTIIYGLDLTLRFIRFRVKDAKLEAVDDQMTLIHIQNCGSGWRAGQHVHVRLIAPNGVSSESHSFSIINAPRISKSPTSVFSQSSFPTTPNSATPLIQNTDISHENQILTLAARVTGTWTRDLNSLAQTGIPSIVQPGTSQPAVPAEGTPAADLKSPIRVLVDGPYGAPPKPQGERVVMVCGGSGAAYILGVLSDWLDEGDVFDDEEDDDSASNRSSGPSCVHSILLIWYIRKARCVRWFADSLRRVGALARARGVTIVIRICVTREQGLRISSEDGTGSPSGAAKDYRLSTLSDLDARQQSYLVTSENEGGLLGLGLPGSIEFARPCIGDIVQEQINAWAAPEIDVESEGDAYEQVADDDSDDDDAQSLSTGGASSLLPNDGRRGTGVFVVCCGPMPMVHETKAAVARLPARGIRRAGGVWVHTEAYEL